MDKFLIGSSKKYGAQPSAKTSNSFKRKYSEDYLEFGFVYLESDCSIPMCIVCSKCLTNESMVKTKLLRHLESCHPDLKNAGRVYFEKLKIEKEKQSKRMKKHTSVSEKALIASFEISHLIVKNKKPHTDGEKIILPALLIATKTMLSDEAAETVKQIPLSDSTVSRRILDMSEDIDNQVKEQFRGQDELENLWAFQSDESTDISNKAQLMAFIRFNKNGVLVSQYFFCCEIKTTTTGEISSVWLIKMLKKD
jgi:hypothetical protein